MPTTKVNAQASVSPASIPLVPPVPAVAADGDPNAAIQPQDEVPRLRIRMYRHGLGDCLLLRFRRQDGEGTFNVLIDCGLIMVAKNAKATMINVAKDIEAACNNRIDVVVMTHEHWDHASGFSNQQARDIFEKITIAEVWYGWTEDPQNALGTRLRAERAKKLQALASAATALGKSARDGVLTERGLGLNALLGFFGFDFGAEAQTNAIGKTRDAFDYLRHRSNVKKRYCYPDKPPLNLLGVPNVRVYVLGPPQDEGLIKKSSPSKSGREVYELASESKLADNLETAFLRLGNRLDDKDTEPVDDCPFDPALRRRDNCANLRSSPALDKLISSTWDAAGQDWRRIENDWTQAAETLALNLDTHTNNTCVVLAFEFTDTGEVFLFPADAQVGNWLSWQDQRWKVKSTGGMAEVTGPDLLARTVFYKVGHHGSHNATLRSLGLEQMTHEDLIAFIPVFRTQAMTNRWMGMPFDPLVKRLGEKTGGRLLQSDTPVPSAAQLGDLPAAAQERFALSISTGPEELWFEYRIG